jgi:hypothetical protein
MRDVMHGDYAIYMASFFARRPKNIAGKNSHMRDVFPASFACCV